VVADVAAEPGTMPVEVEAEDVLVVAVEAVVEGAPQEEGVTEGLRTQAITHKRIAMGYLKSRGHK
jgi:hypothetical protein